MCIDANAHRPRAKEDFIRTIYYGHLEYILQCTIPPNTVSKNIKPELVLLAIITTCDTQGHNATLEPTYFKSLTSYVEVVDIAAICAVVSRIQVGAVYSQWAIINRSGDWARTVFTDDSLGGEVSQGAEI